MLVDLFIFRWPAILYELLIADGRGINAVRGSIRHMGDLLLHKYRQSLCRRSRFRSDTSFKLSKEEASYR